MLLFATTLCKTFSPCQLVVFHLRILFSSVSFDNFLIEILEVRARYPIVSISLPPLPTPTFLLLYKTHPLIWPRIVPSQENACCNQSMFKGLSGLIEHLTDLSVASQNSPFSTALPVNLRHFHSTQAIHFKVWPSSCRPKINTFQSR